MAASRNGKVQSVDRAIDILEALAGSSSPSGVTELVKELGLPYATVHRLLQALISRGFVSLHDASRKYTLGPKLLALGQRAGTMFSAHAEPFLRRLVTATGETANMAIFENDHVVYVAQVQSTRTVRMFTEVGNRVLPHGTAVGKVLLSSLPLERQRETIERIGLPAYTPNTITDPEKFLAHLQRVKEQGWAEDDEEREIGVCCLAVPVQSSSGFMAAFSVSGPAGRIKKEDRPDLISAMKSIAGDFVSTMDKELAAS